MEGVKVTDCTMSSVVLALFDTIYNANNPSKIGC